MVRPGSDFSVATWEKNKFDCNSNEAEPARYEMLDSWVDIRWKNIESEKRYDDWIGGRKSENHKKRKKNKSLKNTLLKIETDSREMTKSIKTL